jgi:hypothetical protein
MMATAPPSTTANPMPSRPSALNVSRDNGARASASARGSSGTMKTTASVASKNSWSSRVAPPSIPTATSAPARGRSPAGALDSTVVTTAAPRPSTPLFWRKTNTPPQSMPIATSGGPLAYEQQQGRQPSASANHAGYGMLPGAQTPGATGKKNATSASAAAPAHARPAAAPRQPRKDHRPRRVHDREPGPHGANGYAEPGERPRVQPEDSGP